MNSNSNESAQSLASQKKRVEFEGAKLNSNFKGKNDETAKANSSVAFERDTKKLGAPPQLSLG